MILCLDMVVERELQLLLKALTKNMGTLSDNDHEMLTDLSLSIFTNAKCKFIFQNKVEGAYAILY